MSSDEAKISEELDAVHAAAQRAFQAKDVAAYMDLFSPSLSYKQHDGRVIGREQLTKDVASQLRAMKSSGSSYVRESIDVEGSEATEVLRQEAWAEITVLLFFRRRWKIHRKGRYTWLKTRDGWRIRNVEVLEEAVS